MSTGLGHLLPSLVAGAADTTGTTADDGGNGVNGTIVYAAFLLFIICLVVGTIIVAKALRGRKDKSGALAPLYPGRYPSTKEDLRRLRRGE